MNIGTFYDFYKEMDAGAKQHMANKLFLEGFESPKATPKFQCPNDVVDHVLNKEPFNVADVLEAIGKTLPMTTERFAEKYLGQSRIDKFTSSELLRELLARVG